MKHALLAVLLAWPTLASAHPLAPALLELRAKAQGYEVLWRTPVVQVRGAQLSPQLPPDCVAQGAPSRALRDNEALELRWTVDCTDLAGKTLSVTGLETSGINVVVRVEERDGRIVNGLLDARRARFVVPDPGSSPRRFAGYFSLGVEHLLTGLDHVLFVLGLLVLARGFRPLVLTVTAFTLGHSLTLAAATLGFVRVSPALTELGIALSLVAVALAILRPADAPALLRRRPASIALGFGLLHGLGFAGALSGIGLPQDEIPASLLAFNLGIEAGQLLLIAVALGLAALARKWTRAQWTTAPALTQGVAAYIIGSLAACWCIERTMVLVG